MTTHKQEAEELCDELIDFFNARGPRSEPVMITAMLRCIAVLEWNWTNEAEFEEKAKECGSAYAEYLLEVFQELEKDAEHTDRVAEVFSRTVTFK